MGDCPNYPGLLMQSPVPWQGWHRKLQHRGTVGPGTGVTAEPGTHRGGDTGTEALRDSGVRHAYAETPFRLHAVEESS